MTDLYYQSSEWVEIQKEMHEDENAKSIMDEFKKYNFTQVRKALENNGFAPSKSFGDETSATTIFEKPNGTSYGFELATVEECIEEGTCTIDGLCPKEWGRINN